MTPQELIIKRVQLLAQKAELESQYAKWIENTIPQEVKDKIAELEAERKMAVDAAVQTISTLEDEIKSAVLQAGATVKVEDVGMAIFNKGRVTWETKGLDGLMVAVPELEKFRKVGDPYVTFR